MLDHVLLSVAAIGSTIAGIWDLKTTEIPDEIPYTMIVIGVLIHLIKSISTWSYLPILYSCIVGFSFLAFGFLLYYGGQWGGGDAKLLSAIGFLLPTYPKATMFPFSISFLLNLFFIGAIYMILYAIVLAFIERKVILKFVSDVKASSKILVLSFVGVGILAVFMVFIFSKVFYVKFMTLDFVWFSLTCIVGSALLFLLFRFVKAVEEVAFKKRIPISELKVGDVLATSKIWEGITEEQLREIKKSGKKYIEIKEGVRFAPAFILALLFTLLYGDSLLLVIRFGF